MIELLVDVVLSQSVSATNAQTDRLICMFRASFILHLAKGNVLGMTLNSSVVVLSMTLNSCGAIEGMIL